MVPHSWIIECLDLFGVAENIKSLLVNSMEKWKVMLRSGNSASGEVEIYLLYGWSEAVDYEMIMIFKVL